VVGSTSEAARHTSKFISGWPVGFSYMAARWAGSGSVPRIDKDQGNACDLGVVVYKHPEQSEIPCMQIATLCLCF